MMAEALRNHAEAVAEVGEKNDLPNNIRRCCGARCPVTQPDGPPGQPLSGRQPAGRYRTPGGGGGVVGRVLTVALAAAALGWLIWAALAAANPDVRSQVLEFRALDDNRVEATVEVVASSGSVVDCTLRAQDADHVTTGVGRLVSPGGSADRRVERTVIKTRDRAVVVTVGGCRRRG
jgi:hypothetical protein